MQIGPVIYLVDDDDAFRTALTRLLQAAGYRVRSYGSAGEFSQEPIDATSGCLLLDLYLPGLSGLDLQESLAQRAQYLPTIFLSGFGDIPTAVRAIKAGAVDFLPKPVNHQQLFAAINTALARQAENCLHHDQSHHWRGLFDTLSPREREVLQQIICGKHNKEIADTLGTCERTAKAHKASVMKKMQTKSIAELVQICLQLGLVTMPPLQKAVPA
jgi:FixJ family two-component response regulator